MPIAPNVAYNQLVAGPEAFLKTYPIRIFGSTGASGPAAIYYMLNRAGAVNRPGSVLGTWRMHATESFEIRAAGGAMMAVDPTAPRQQITAHSVHMDVGAPAMTFYRLDGTGPAIMLTGQLSGCSFVMVDAGGNQVDVAHVKPGGGQTGKALFTALGLAHPNAQVYGDSGNTGNYDSDIRKASILGFRVGANWRIYAQKQDGNYSIKSAYQIWPNRRKL